MPPRWLIWEVWALLTGIGLTCSVDLSIDHKDAGYFLKPLFGGHQPWGPSVTESLFIVTHPKGVVKVKAGYGPFTAEEEVAPSLLQQSLGNQSILLNNVVVDDMDVSAHLVTRSITQERPKLQVLFHASHPREIRNGKKNKKVALEAVGHNESKSWCLKMHVQKGEHEFTSVCEVSHAKEVCVAELLLPVEWWDPLHIQSADVYYSVYHVAESLQCANEANTIVPEKVNEASERIKSYIGTVTLTSGQLTFAELKEDQHVLVYIPQKTFYPGSTFHVPMQLQAESDLTLFVVRVKARHGLKVIGAVANDPTRWRITVDLNHKRRGAMVTAFVADKDNYAKTDRIQAVFDWVFQVEDDIEDEDPGRIILNLEYEMTSHQRETYGSVENRVIGRVQIQHDDTFTIVPVVKTTELINKAILTGRVQNFLMRVYSLSQAGRITDITSQTTCHSGDTEVLKVSPACNLVYLDGSEVKGSPSVSVIAKYGRHTKFLFFKVWVPEIPLQVELSDYKLSQIKGWKAPQHQRRKARDLDFGLLTHPELLLEEEVGRREEYTTSCHLRFQQATVEVFARFYVPDSSRDQFLVHRKALLRITELVRDQLRIADASIATLNGNVVEGLRPGRTEIQVLSRMGRVIGVKEIRVGNDKVSIERLEVDVVTGLGMMVTANTELPGTLATRVVRQEQLRKKYQEGLLDVSVKFSDGTNVPLRHVPPADYFLDMDTLNNHVVAFGPMLSPDRPRIIALGQGKGELLKLALELGDACQKKKSRPLAVSYVYVDVDFSKDGENENREKLQNDGHFNINNHASDRHDTHDVETEKGVLHVSVDDGKGDARDVKPQPPGGVHNERGGGSLGGIVVDDDLSLSEAGMESRPNSEAQQQPMSTARGMTALEIGMYVLLGVFCLAIIVFMVNCMIFVWRYRRKRLPHEVRDSIQNAQDWVWIGRATLERNSINTQCSQTLMPESDFNGNQSVAAAPPAAAAAAAAPPATATPVSPPGGQPVANPNLLHPNPGGTASARSSNTGSLGSNRNSVVSTYKGSECSIRITSNPHPEANPAVASGSGLAGTSTSGSNQNVANNNLNNNLNTNPQPSTSTADSPGGAEGGACGGANLNNNPGGAGLQPIPPPVPPHRHLNQNHLPQHRHHPPGHHNHNLMHHHHSYPNANGYPNPRDYEWDYEAMGMTYDQLMEYFDNLKESTA